MAVTKNETSFVKPMRVDGLIALLKSAACEWFLIFLLLLEAALSYLLARFARYCQLQLPCLLCTRLDRILGCEKQEFYQNLFCSDHRSELSSLVSCHIHGKVADGNLMCDDCLLSFTTSTKQNTKSHRLLLGKFGVVLGGSGSQSPSLSRDLFNGSKASRPCACCGNLWKSEPNASRSIQIKSPGRAVIKPCIPLPNVPRQSRMNHRENTNKTRDKAVASETKMSFQSLNHVGYTELKLTSDSESDFPFSDDDDVVSVSRGNFETSNGPLPQFKPVAPPRHVLIGFDPVKQHSIPPKAMPSYPAPSVKPEIMEHHGVGSVAANQSIPEETKWQTENQKPSSSNLPELISLDEVSSPPLAVNTANGESEDSKTASGLSQDSLPASISELMTLDGIQTLDAASSDKSVDVTQASGTELVSKEHEEVVEKIDATENASTEAEPMVSESAPESPKQENSDNMSKSPDFTKEGEVSGCVAEQPTNEEVNAVVEEMELSPSHDSSPHGSNKSSVVSMDHIESLELHDEASSPNATTGLISKSASVESDLELLDDGNITDIEGESIVDKLKRKIKHDKSYMEALQKELEEERNASAIAANEAMSMITRLQEEKAALQMEGLHYLRMMEEQAEYDNDELDKVNDLLTEKEKEIQDLEAELEYYKMNWPEEYPVNAMQVGSSYPRPDNITKQNVGVHTDEPVVQSMQKESSDPKGENVEVQNAGVDEITNTTSISDSKLTEESNVNDGDVAAGENTPLEFEEEKLYITQRLKTLEKKLRQFSSNAMSTNLPNGSPQKLEAENLDQHGSSNGEESQLDGQEETDFSIQKPVNMYNGTHMDKDGSAHSDSDENNHSTSVESKSPAVRREVDLDALENEISDLNDRLEALELDHEFLEHIINSLRNGDDGKQFIHDIAHQLHELRKIGMRLRCIADV